MSDFEGMTQAGDPVLRHTAEGAVSGSAPMDAPYADVVVHHMESAYGPVVTVWHELVSDVAHVDVHFIEPTSGPKRRVLFTTGMSDLPMNTPPGADVPRRAELMLVLPPDWHVDQQSLQSEQWGWPVVLLKFLARLPHQYQTWLGSGHTIPNDDPPVPYVAGTDLCCSLLIPPIQSMPQDKWVVHADDGERIAILCVYPIHKAEMDLKLEKGLDALLDPFDEAGVSEVVDLKRQSSVETPRKKRFGLF